MRQKKQAFRGRLFRSVRGKILLYTVLVTVVSVIVIETIVVSYFSRIYTKDSMENCQKSTAVIAQELDNLFQQQIRFIQAYAVWPETQRCITQYHNADQYTRTRLVLDVLNMLGQNSIPFQWRGFGIYIENNGYYACTTSLYKNAILDSEYFSDELIQKYYQQTPQREVFFTTIYHSSPAKSEVFGYSSNIYCITGEKASEARFIIEVDAKLVYDILSQELLADYDSFCIVNSINEIIYQKEKNGILQNNAINYLEKNGVWETANGIVVIDQCNCSDWEIVAFYNKDTVTQWIMPRILFVFLLCLAIITSSCFCISFLLLKRVLHPIGELTDRMREVASSGNMDIKLSLKTGDEFEVMADQFSDMLSSLKESTQNVLKLQKSQSEMEYDLLVSQTNPHFIYNNLNNIALLIEMKRTEEAHDMTVSMIQLLMNTVRMGSEETTATLDTEIQIARAYLQIQSVRYSGLFQIEWNIEPEISDCILPRMVIQPLVENALIYGILPDSRQGMLRICAFRDSNCLTLTVSNTGIPMKEEIMERINRKASPHRNPNQSTGVGIRNIQRRIELLYGSEYGLTAEYICGWTVVTVVIPMEKAKSETIQISERNVKL